MSKSKSTSDTCSKCGKRVDRCVPPCPVAVSLLKTTKEINEAERIAQIRAQLATLGEELLKLTAPTDEEIRNLVEDAETEPGIYISYLVEDPIFLAENILDFREADQS